MNKVKKNSIFLFGITIFLMWYILKDNFNDTFSMLLKCNLWWVFGGMLSFFIYFIIEAIIFKDITAQYKKDYTLAKSIKLMIMTKFFNGITPFSSGGQPLQVYELSRDNVKPTYGTLAVVEHFLIFQTSLVFLALITLLSNLLFDVVHAEPFLDKLTVFGFSINIGLLLIVYFLCRYINIGKKIIRFIINTLAVFKIVKNKEEKINKWNQMCDEYYQGYMELMNNKHLIKKSLILETICLIFQFLVPIFVFNSLGFTGTLDIFVAVMIATYAFFVGSFIPMPGGAGGVEYAFVGFYSYYIGLEYLSPALLIWRFITYYLPMIIGGIVFNISNKLREKEEKSNLSRLKTNDNI